MTIRAFARRRGRYVASIDPAERAILAGVLADTAALLGDRPGLSEQERGEGDDDVGRVGAAGRPEPGGPGDPGDPGDSDGSAAPEDSDGSGDAGYSDDAGDTGESGNPDDPDAENPDDADDLAAQMEWLGRDVPEPTDPALARLLPPASHDDEELADEFRRLTQQDLRDEKIARLHQVWAALRAPGTKISLAPEQAMDWAAALNDVRLVLSERLGIETDADAEDVYELAGATPGQPTSEEEELRLAMASVYSAFTWLQESLIQVMLPTLGD